jgi:hypothetical protein
MRATSGTVTQTVTLAAGRRQVLACDALVSGGFYAEVDVTSGAGLVVERVLAWPQGAYAGSAIALGLVR